MTNDDIIPEEMINMAVLKFGKSGRKSKRAYTEADKNPETEYGLEQLKSGNVYSDFQMLYSMMAVTMAGINTVNKKLEKLANKEDVSAIKSELTNKVNETLQPLREIMKQQQEREGRDAEIYE
jgi:predicted ribosome quality control (RQC) complex YloA/Tae2 family protein